MSETDKYDINQLIRDAKSVMCDSVVARLKAKYGYHFEVKGATYVVVKSSNGETVKTIGNRVKIMGKYGIHTFHVRVLENGKILEIEGAISASLYGQNAFGSNSLARVMKRIIKLVIRKLGLTPPLKLIKEWMQGKFTIVRIDVAVNFQFQSEVEVHDVIKQSARQLLENDKHMSNYRTTTIYQPRGGKDYSISFYGKGAQMRCSNTANKLSDHDKLIQECDRILRLELRLQSNELKLLGLNIARVWSQSTPMEVINTYTARLDFLRFNTGAIAEDKLVGVSNPMLQTLALYAAGKNWGKNLSPRTVQRRLAEGKQLNLDLRCPPPANGSTRSIFETLSDKVMTTPKWMIDAGIAPTTMVRSVGIEQVQSCEAVDSMLEQNLDADDVQQMKPKRKGRRIF
jgi:hypothetical protein